MTVSVLMPTYNHQRYIASAIESFLDQSVDFPIELLIGDDCSTDQTAQIARTYADQYPDRIKFFSYPQNGGLMRNYKQLIDQAKGEYIAILESDDQWISTLKLKKQVNFMRSHPECGLVFTDCLLIDQDDKIILDQATPTPSVDYSLLLKGCRMSAVTVLFSSRLFRQFCSVDRYIERGYPTFDYPTWIALAANSKVGYLHDFTSTYRILPSSISNSNEYQKAITFNQGIDRILDDSTARFGNGTLSDKEIHNARVLRYFMLALEFGKLGTAWLLGHKIRVTNIRTLAIKCLPPLWIIQHCKIYKKSRWRQ